MNKITLKGPAGPITLVFGTWVLNRFCQLEGKKFSEVTSSLNDFSLQTMFNLICAALDFEKRKAGDLTSSTDIEAAEIVDLNGGIGDSTWASMISVFADSIAPPIPADEEKKSQEAQASTSLSNESAG